MPLKRTLTLLLLSLLFFYGRTQTLLYPGDIILLSAASDMGLCGLPSGSDEISFTCFNNITNGTTFEITDNGWEHTFPGYWGDGEGTLSITRTGGTVPRGTIIVLEVRQVAPGNFTYRITAPDNQWAIANINVPGGPFNLVNSDQIYFLSGGTWNNQGGGANRAIYDGNVVHAANLQNGWIANGTDTGSNLHPQIASGCYYIEPSGPPGTASGSGLEYAGPIGATTHFEWLHRVQWWPDINSYQNCLDMNMVGYNWPSMGSIALDDNFFFHCFNCEGCAPLTDGLILNFPVGGGPYVMEYTNGTDTFTLDPAQDDEVIAIIVDTMETWSIVSLTDPLGCKIYSYFGNPVSYDPIDHDVGLHAHLYVCPELDDPIYLFWELNGTPELGGYWIPQLYCEGIFCGLFVSSLHGEGSYYYLIDNLDSGGNPVCPPDTASVKVTHVDLSASTYEVECHQNGTPNDIYDDYLIITLNVTGEGFGEQYFAYTNVGTLSPGIPNNIGFADQPSVFTLNPGSALYDNVVISIKGSTPYWCEWEFDIEEPGFCSDPCDHSMQTELSGNVQNMCIGNCPEEPGELSIEVSGGTEPYRMDFTVTGSTGTFNFNGIPMADVEDIEICVGGNAAPSYNSATNTLVIPEAFANSEFTFTLHQVYDMFDCTGSIDNGEYTIFVHPLPSLGAPTLEFCSEEASSVDLTQFNLDVHLFLDVKWYDGNPLEGGDLIQFPVFANLFNIGELWVYVADDFCENARQVPYTIYPTPELEPVAPREICEGTVVNLEAIPLFDAAQSMATYTYHSATPPTPMNLLDPTHFLTLVTDTVYVLATGEGGCYDTLPIIINVHEYPTFLLEQQPCDLANDTWSVLFSTTADSARSNLGTVILNPNGQDTVVGIPNDTPVSIILYTADGLCKDTFDIVAPNCDCPLINQPVASPASFQICEDQAIPLMSVTVDPGLIANWYTIPSGGVPIAANSLTFQPVNPVNSTYYVEALDQTTGCYSIRTQITLQVHPKADLEMLADPVLCEEETINFSVIAPAVLNGVGGTGQWFILGTNTQVSGTIVPVNGASWYYSYSTNPGSCVSRDTIMAVVNPLPAMDVFDLLCDDQTLTYSISFTTDATTVSASDGTLTQVGTTDTFHLTNIPFNTDIQFSLQNDLTGCTATADVAAPDCSCPPLLAETSETVCSSNGLVDLSGFEGPGVNGTWQLVSTPPGGNPATLTGATFDGQNADAGDYRLRFIRNIILDDCVDTAFFDLELVNAPVADAGVNGTVCAGDIIQLSGTVTGTGAMFSWTENGGGSISNPNALNTTYTPTQGDITSGTVQFTLSATDPSGVCPAAQDVITMSIDARGYYELNAPAQVYCDTSDILVNLTPLISFGETDGEWFYPDTVNAPVLSNNTINPSDLTPGTYTIFYTTSQAVAPCENDTTAVTIIIENCMCPSVAISAPADGLCSETGSLDLSTLEITSEPGTWTIVQSPPGGTPATIAGTVFRTQSSTPGTYRIRFTLNAPVAGCDEFAETTIEVIEEPSLSIVSVGCSDDLLTWEAIIQSSSATVSSSVGTLTPVGGNRYEVTGLTLGSAIQIDATSGGGLCSASLNITAPDCDCSISIIGLPDEIALCPGDEVTLEGDAVDGKGDVESYWVDGQDTIRRQEIDITSAGQYSFVSVDSLGCKDEHVVDVSFYTEMITDLSIQDVQCPGDRDGIIFLNAIMGGQAPYQISVNGVPSGTISSFPFILNDLAAGNYTIELTDAQSCVIEVEVQVASASSESISLGPDQTILVGDSALVSVNLSFAPDSFKYGGDVLLLDPSSLSQWIFPEQNQTISVQAWDEKGCLYEDEVLIRVLLESSIYVPTIFSPNGDGQNDIIAPFADASVIEIEYFEIFSRWGELVYSLRKFDPQQNTVGWDGTVKGKAFSPGVFVYRLSAINKRGAQILKSGDITLIR